MEQRVGIWFCILVAVGLSATAIPAGKAQATFTEFGPSQTLSGPGVDAANSQLVIDSQGRTTVVWMALSGDREFRLIQAVRLNADGIAGSVQTLSSEPNLGYPKGCACPRLTVDPEDRVTVAWQIFDGEDLRVEAVQLGADGIPGPVHALSEVGEDAVDQQVAVDAAGRATVIWTLRTAPAVIQSVRLVPGEAPGAVKPLSAAGTDADDPDIAIDQQGIATVAWSSPEGVQAVRLDANGTPGPVTSISPLGEDAALPQVVVDSKGRATVAWWRGAGAYEVKAVRIGADGTPASVQTLSPEAQDVLSPQLAVDPQDRVFVAWEDFNQQVFSIRLDEGALPGPVLPLSSPDRVAGHPHLVAVPGGGAVVTWTHPPVAFLPPWEGCLDLEFEKESDAVQAVAIGPDGIPGPVRLVSGTGKQSQEAQVAVDSQGHPTLVWHSFDGTFFCSSSDPRVESSRGLEILEEMAPAPAPASLSLAATKPARRNGTLRLARSAILVRGRWATARAMCIGGASSICKGAVKLIASIQADDAGPRRSREHLNERSNQVCVARGLYSIAGGVKGIVKLRLTRFGMSLVKRTAQERTRVTLKGQRVERAAVFFWDTKLHHDETQSPSISLAQGSRSATGAR
jgi:hypothetical protein